MSVVRWVRQGTATADVLEELGLDPHDDQPLIEWRSIGTREVLPDVTFVGATTSGVPASTLALPAGSQVGDLVVVAIAARTSSAVSATDPRLTASEDAIVLDGVFGFNNSWFVGYGIATDLGAVTGISVGSDTHPRIVVATYRVAGTPGHVWTGPVGVVDGVPITPAVPAGAAGIAVLVGNGAFNPNPQFADDTTGEWTSDSSGHTTTDTVLIAHATGDPLPVGSWSLPAHGANYAVLTIGLGTTTEDNVWTTDADRSHSLISYQLAYGRADGTGKVPPSQITARCATLFGAPPEIGDPFRITLCDAAAAVLELTEDEAARFTGEITDVELDPEGETWTVIGVHQEARQARATVDLTGTPAETLHDRLVDVLTLVGADVGEIDAGGQLIAAPEDLTAASTLLDLASDSGPGQVVPQLDGTVDWHGREHRRSASSEIVLGTGEILSDLTWAKRVGAVVNVATVSYAGGVVQVIDHASRDLRGEYPISIDTGLVERDDAIAVGVLVVGRRTIPTWIVPTLNLDVARTIDPTHLAQLLKLRHSSRLTVDDLPDTGVEDVPDGDFDFFLEGFTETATRRAWRLGLSVTDPAFSGVSVRWMDAEPGLRWDDVYPDLRWLDVSRIEDPTELGIPGSFLEDYDAGGSGAVGPYDHDLDGGSSGAAGPYDHDLDGGAAA